MSSFQRRLYMKMRLNKYLEKYELPSQYRFREARSTKDAISVFTINIALDNCTPCFVDLAQAFDTGRQHQKLVERLDSIGIRGKRLTLFESYLSDKKHCITINGENIMFITVKYAVPQGTVLGPVLINICLRSLFLQKTQGTPLRLLMIL